MKKALVLALIVVSVALGYSFAKDKFWEKDSRTELVPKVEVLRFALVADSGDENELLAKALTEARNRNASFVIGLGDWTTIGTLDQLAAARKVFDESGLEYFLTAGDHDLWDSRNRGSDALTNYRQIFGDPSREFSRNGIRFLILDNSDVYRGMGEAGWRLVEKVSKVSQVSQVGKKSPTFDTSDTFDTCDTCNLAFVFAHKTPFHPQSAHVMGENNAQVATQAKRLMLLLEEKKIDGFFSGDLHFFAQFNSPNGSVKMTTIGAASSERNFQGPRFAIVKVNSDYSWEIEDVEIE